MTKPRKEIHVLKEVKRKKVITIEHLASLLDCSPRTAQRRLKQWQTFRSYNQNSRFYTLPSIPKFDECGLWRHKRIFFSKYGNLKQAVIHIVKNSKMGLDAGEIGKLVGLSPRSFMSHLRDVPGLHREKYEGRFVYFSDEKDSQLKQKQKRKEALKHRALQLPSDTDAVFILVDRIKHPGSTIEECSRRLREKVKDISHEAIRFLFEYHGIVKKTRDTQP